jgi:hypothetical protein
MLVSNITTPYVSGDVIHSVRPTTSDVPWRTVQVNQILYQFEREGRCARSTATGVAAGRAGSLPERYADISVYSARGVNIMLTPGVGGWHNAVDEQQTLVATPAGPDADRCTH